MLNKTILILILISFVIGLTIFGTLSTYIFQSSESGYSRGIISMALLGGTTFVVSAASCCCLAYIYSNLFRND